MKAPLSNLSRATLCLLMSALLSSCGTRSILEPAQPSIVPTASVTDASREVGTPSETTTAPPKYLPANQFAGLFEASFEVSSFVPCAVGGPTGYGNGYWIEFDWQSDFARRYGELTTVANGNMAQGSELGAAVYVEFLGAQMNPEYAAFAQGGEYGHMGQYDGDILFVELIEMVPIEAQQCKSN